MTIRGALLVALLVSVVGCSAPEIDGSTDDAFKASVEKARESLPADQRNKFDAAVMGLAFQDFDLMKAATLGANSITADMRHKLAGKSAQEIIAEFAKIEAERADKERQAAVEELDELQKERATSEAAKRELEKFVIERARFSIDRNGLMAQPIIELRVRNATSHAVARAHFHGRLVSPGRSVAWLEEDFNYPIRGGIEAGEVAEWRLAPNAFGSWSVQAPPDAGLQVTVVRLDGVDGKALFDAREFSAEDLTRLAALEKQLGSSAK